MFIAEIVSMRTRVLVPIISLTLLLVIQCRIVYGEYTVEYTVQISIDGSAAWLIRQTGTGIQSSLDTLMEFRDRAVSLVEAAKNRTQRTMATDENEFSLAYKSSGSYVTIEYRFSWQNFSKIENKSIIVGDVFQVKNFFEQLYGDGQLHMTYPSGYVVQKASPPPYERNDSLHTLSWLGTKDFVEGSSAIILEKQSLTLGLLETIEQNAIIVASLIALITGSSVSFYEFRRRKKREAKKAETPAHPIFPQIEGDEDKIVKLLKSSSNGLYQSAITEYFGFSKAKTSQLLTALENKGVVKRQKRGRERIVILLEQNGK